MTQQTFPTKWGGNIVITFNGDLVSQGDPAGALYDKIDIDLRADAVADPSKLCTVVFYTLPCTGDMCTWGTITAPAVVLMRLVQESMQAALEITPPFEASKVPQTGKYDCPTAAYMVVVHQLLKGSGAGEVAGWPLDALEFRSILQGSATLFQLIQTVAAPDYTGFAIVLPDDTKAVKFYRAEVPVECGKPAQVIVQATRWGLVAAIGIGVAGVIGATYAISQRTKHANVK
jgi:hypothetical protein